MPEVESQDRSTGMRLFLGLPVPDHLAQRLARHARMTNLANARWATPENLHITLVFLGLVSEGKLPALMRDLDGLRPPSLQLHLSGIDTFPLAGVLFAEVAPDPKLMELQEEIAFRMTRCGFEREERPYHPHITLACLRRPVRLSEKTSRLPLELRRSFSVEAVNLYQSHTGGRYEVIAQK